MKIIKPVWIALHVVLTALLYWAMLQDFTNKGTFDPKSVGQGTMLIFISFVMVVFLLALLKKLGEKLFPALRRLQSQEAVRHQR